MVQADLARVQGKENYVGRCCISSEETQSASKEGCQPGVSSTGIVLEQLPRRDKVYKTM